MDTTNSFKSLEQKCLEKALEYGRKLMEDALVEIDDGLRDTRNKKELRHRGKREKTICTVLGDIRISRNSYEDKSGRRVYLLDEYLGLEKGKVVSPMICEHIANLICGNSYRTTAEEISNLTGTYLSHETVWNVVQDMGEKADDMEMEAAGKAKKKERNTRIIVLFTQWRLMLCRRIIVVCGIFIPKHSIYFAHFFKHIRIIVISTLI